jgi:Tol biopolymer transport system component
MSGWSHDSSTLYFYYAFSFDGALTLWSGFDLQGLDVASGDTWPLVPSERLIAFAFSPDSFLLAFAREDDQPRRLTLRNLPGGLERTIDIGLPTDVYTQVGWLSWSPGGTGLLYWTEADERMNVYYVNERTMRTQHLLGYLGDQYSFQGWVDEAHVQFQLMAASSPIELDVQTGSIVGHGSTTPDG